MKFAGINLANFMDAEGFDEGLITRNAIDANSKLKRAGMIAKGSLLGAGLKAMADIEMGKLGASATEYAGQQAGNSALFSGIMGGLSGLGSGIIGRKPPGFGPDPLGSQGNPMFSSDILPGTIPGGPAIGGGRIPLNG